MFAWAVGFACWAVGWAILRLGWFVLHVGGGCCCVCCLGISCCVWFLGFVGRTVMLRWVVLWLNCFVLGLILVGCCGSLVVICLFWFACCWCGFDAVWISVLW